MAGNMNNPREDGLSSREEFDTLSALADRLHESMISKHSSVYAGWLTTDGPGILSFTRATTLFYDKTISEAMIAHASYNMPSALKRIGSKILIRVYVSQPRTI